MLDKSGIVWGHKTVQFRFLFYHNIVEYARDYRKDMWHSTRLLDIISTLFVPYTQESDRTSYYDRSFGALKEILGIGNPYEKMTTQNKQQATDTDREKYLRQFGKKAFGSMNEIVDAMDKINSNVRK